MKILALDTSCDETAAALTEGNRILTNIIWSQTSLHAKWGGVVPSLAQREHEKRIDWVITKALGHTDIASLDAIAVTAGPGLSIALGVGIQKAKQLAVKYKKPIVAVNHIEGHLLSSLAIGKNPLKESKIFPTFPSFGLVVSGGTTQIILIEDIGKYKIIASTVDDALGEALDKAARMLGFGYPGAAALEKVAKEGDPKKYILPVPMAGQEEKMKFSYSGLKTAMWRLMDSLGPIKDSKTTMDLAASFQDKAFKHLTRVLKYTIDDYRTKNNTNIGNLLVGGGVVANMELRKRLRTLCTNESIKCHFPYSKKLTGDNAAMIGVAAGYKFAAGKFLKGDEINKIDRIPRAKIDLPFPWEITN